MISNRYRDTKIFRGLYELQFGNIIQINDSVYAQIRRRAAYTYSDKYILP